MCAAESNEVRETRRSAGVLYKPEKAGGANRFSVMPSRTSRLHNETHRVRDVCGNRTGGKGTVLTETDNPAGRIAAAAERLAAAGPFGEAPPWRGYKDNWKRKEGNAWVRCESPTKQNLRHRRLFAEWLKGLGLCLPGDFGEYVFPAVLFTLCRWLKAEYCFMPVFRDGAELVGYLRRCVKERELFSPGQMDAVARALADAKTLCTQFGVERMEKVKTAKGKECVRVLGREEKANLVRGMYAARGRIVSKVFPDKREAGWWCFYVGI